MSYRLMLAAGAAVLLAACDTAPGSEEGTTESGLRYVIHERSGDTTKPEIGEVVTVHMVMRNAEDSVLRDTYDDPRPLMFELAEAPFRGSIEEGLQMLSIGDSATFYVNADSLYQGGVRPDFVGSGSEVSFDVKLVNVQSREEAMAAQQQMMEEERQRVQGDIEAHVAIDDSLIQAYVAENDLNTRVTDSGLHVMVEEEGDGEQPQPGNTVEVNYRLTTLDGDEIDSSYKRNETFKFVLGRGQVIPGWDEGIGLLKEGSKAKLIVPSRLGYNERPLGGNAPAFSVLVFDVELLGIEE